MVMLLTALVVAFMLRAGSEKQSSGYYRAEATARDLSDTTLNLVEGEINEATTQGINYAWASQPGAIRVFDNTGAPYKIFKLYSSNSLCWSAATDATTTSVQAFLTTYDNPPTSGTPWYNLPGQWVDLNAPVNSDPNPSATTGLGNPSFTHFPILDPRDPVNSTKTIAMDGFSLPTPGMTVPYDTTNIDSNGKPNPAPMPVQWLYVLQNGTLTAPTSGPDASGNYAFTVAPSATNPIVGRVAFWTDDETCKVNINTAGADGIMGTTALKDRADPSAIAQGSFWSPPYFAAPDDTGPGSIYGPFSAGFCTAQPVSGEYQRYPGHPATVALSNILNTLRPSSTSTPYINTSTFYAASPTTPGITPRYIYGGTQENTVNTFGNGTYGSAANLTVTSESTASFRLFPTLSESLFVPARTTTSLNTGDITSRQRMETGRFFLTAHSRAPELNLFGMPRVSIWPMAFNASWRTVVDNLIGFCTTIGGTQGNANDGSGYYFTRSSCGDSTVDIGLKDSSGNYRNAWLLNYLSYLTSQNIPGFGGSFSTKDYGSGSGLTGENNQILTEMFDYIRSTNIQDGTSPSPYDGQVATGGNWNYTSSNGGWWGVGQVVPSLINVNNSGGVLNWNTQGNGSFPRLIEATIQSVAVGQGGIPAGQPGGPVNAIPISPSVVSAFFPNPVLPTTAIASGGVNYPYPTTGVTKAGPPAYGPPPNNTVPGNPSYNPGAYTAFANQNPMGFMLGYPVTPQVPQGDAPFPNSLTYAYNPLVNPAVSTVPVPTTNPPNPYAPPGAIDPPTSAYPMPTAIRPAPPATGPYNTIYRVHNYLTGSDSGIPPDGTTAVQAYIILTFINPAQDWIYCSPCVWVTISGLSNFQLNGHALNFPDPDCMLFASGQDWHGGGRSGYSCMDCNFQGKSNYFRSAGQVNQNVWSGNPFFSGIIPIAPDSNVPPKMAFRGGTVTFQLYDAIYNYSGGFPAPNGAGAPSGGHLVQTYNIIFPSSSIDTIPIPVLTPNPLPIAKDMATYQASPDTCYPPLSAFSIPPSTTLDYTPPKNSGYVPYVPWINPNVAYGAPNGSPPYTNVSDFMITGMEETGPIVGFGQPAGAIYLPNSLNCPYYYRWNQPGQFIPIADQNFIDTGDVVESMVLSKAWSDPRLLAVANVPSSAWVTHPNWGQQFAHNLFYGMVTPAVGNGSNFWNGGTVANGGILVPSPYNTPHTSLGTLAGNVVDPQPMGWPEYPWAPSVFGDNMPPTTVSGNYPPNGFPPDWDCGTTTGSDGPWINKPDEGSATYQSNMPYYGNCVGQPPALFTANRQVCSPGMFGSLPTGVDPNGSKPAGWQTLLFRPGPAAAGYTNMPHPGEGILAGTAAGAVGPLYTTPPDHLWMDLFWIPVTEPYAISEPMSTAGKINLNYQIVPFTYIKRATALRAAMATEKIAQVGLLQSSTCKGEGYQFGVCLNGPFQIYTTAESTEVNARYPIDLDVTLSQFDKKFYTNWDLFRSPSQICEEFLVPMDIPNTLPNGTSAPATPGAAHTSTNPYAASGETVTPAGNYPLPTFLGDTTGVSKFAKDWYTPLTSLPQPAGWENPTAYTNAPFAMVGDNAREQPYAHLYGKLTTKSNTYTVYYRVQSLKEPASLMASGKWNENLGAITGEYRGSTTIERFIDPNEKVGGANVVPDAAQQVVSGTAPTSLEAYYKWRVVENHQFAP